MQRSDNRIIGSVHRIICTLNDATTLHSERLEAWRCVFVPFTDLIVGLRNRSV